MPSPMSSLFRAPRVAHTHATPPVHAAPPPPPASRPSSARTVANAAGKTRKRVAPEESLRALRAMLQRTCGLSERDLADPQFDFVYDEESCRNLAGRRGSESYMPPEGWSKIALNLTAIEPTERRQLLDKDSGWVVAYHGTRASPEVVAGIVRDGFKVRGGAAVAPNGAAYGSGVYCSPTVEYAKEYAAKQPLRSSDGDFLVVFHCRVRPGGFSRHTSRHLYEDGRECEEMSGNPIWLVSNPADIRPIAMLLASGKR
tara:strand:+ start:77 stop:847 length:771 start_codon:yes stop_codon:yes gene_type:complete